MEEVALEHASLIHQKRWLMTLARQYPYLVVLMIPLLLSGDAAK